MARKPDTSVIELKSATLEAMRAILRSPDDATVIAALEARLGSMPGFFSGEPVVIDCSDLPAGTSPDLVALRDVLARHELTAVALQTADERLAQRAQSLGWAVMAAESTSARSHARAEPGETARVEPEAVAPHAAPVAEPLAPEPSVQSVRRTEIVDRPLRSGQRIYARGGDLVVLAMVSAGAEVIADGNIHIYAPLRGRALAGASGDMEARIFTTCFEAELVSIAGVYRTFEQSAGELLRRPAHVRLESHSDKQVLSVAALATN
ncbi:septum site-determining protein MinC [Methyloversatilis thermotolerans]|uniref:septum site-determining protein MinC n=1 Tax=Methyloversatilis thermotolerans TaxID=1346290 RepID=UPI00037B00A2|nr:septum site-determining protein MinC [Methyloversatilis thermotolerans]